jgi:serine protease Do
MKHAFLPLALLRLAFLFTSCDPGNESTASEQAGGSDGEDSAPSPKSVPMTKKGLWQEILGAPQGTVPADPGGKVEWRGDFAAALAEAKATNRPIFVTWRCLPCKQCSEFDKDVLDGSPTLDPLLRRFVTVRLVDASLLDERYFPYKTHQDLDLSWWAYFLSPGGNYYGVFGGKDHVSDKTRISEPALVNSLKRILAHHYDPRRPAWGIDMPAGTASKTQTSPKDSKGYALLKEKRPGMGKPHKEFGACIHCHQVGDMLNMEALDNGTFSVDQYTGKWPLPENVGILLERDDGLLVKEITPGSPAAQAGIQAGDKLAMADGTRLFGQADFRGVLHRATSSTASVEVVWSRGGAIQFGTLQTQPGWRSTENSWRKTVYDGVYGPGLGFWPLEGPNAGKGKGLSIKPWMGNQPQQRPVYQSGLRPNMEIVAIDGMDQDLETRKLISWFRLNHKPGDTVVYKARDGKEYPFTIPAE